MAVKAATDDGAEGRPSGDAPRGARIRRRRATVLAAVAYALLALAAYWPIWPGDPNRIMGCACGDQVEQLWYLAWTPLALVHGHNPFLTNYIEYPRGANMAVNTLMPALGLLGTPLTLTAGGASALNLWFWLAFCLSATACFVLLRRWVRWAPAAFVGGLLYGFSPYMVGQGSGHLQMAFVPLPPLILLALDELVVSQRRRAVTVGLALGLALGLQYLISSEVFGSVLVIAVIGTFLLVVARPRAVAARFRHAATGLGIAGGVCGALIAYPAYLQLAGPNRFKGSAHGAYPFPADLAGLVVPTVHQLLAPSSLVAMSNHFILGDVTENGSYLGIPLILLLLVIVVWRWRLPVVRFAAALAVVAELLALGPTLVVDRRVTGVPLPDRLLDHLPFFDSFVDARFSLYVDLFAAVLLAVGLDQLRTAVGVLRRRATRRRRGPWWSPARWWRPAALGAVVAVALAPLIPDWPYPSVTLAVPAVFSGPLMARIPQGSVALTYPYDESASDQAMLWQVAASVRFRLLGGYVIVPGPDGTASFDPFPPALDSVPATLVADDLGGKPEAVLPGATQATPVQFRRFLERYQIDTVLADPIGARPARALSLFESVLGPPTRAGRIDAWFGVRARLGSGLPQP